MSYFMNQNDFDLIKSKCSVQIDELLDTIHARGDNPLIFDYRNQLIEVFIQGLIDAEFKIFMDNNENQNYKNGKNARQVADTTGYIDLKIPRDRNGNFSPTTLTKYSRTTEDLASLVMALIKTKMSYNDISKFLESHCEVNYSKEAIAGINKNIINQIEDFRKQVYDEKYFALFLDATYIPVKCKYIDETGTVKSLKLAINIACAITIDGYQRILDYEISYFENSSTWDEILTRLYTNGIKNFDIVVTDGFVGIEKVIYKYYRTAKVQRCTFHLLQNLYKKFPKKNRNELMGRSAKIFNASTIKEFEFLVDKLYSDFPQYKHLFDPTFKIDNVNRYLEFDEKYHKIIKTSNRIERVMRQIKDGFGGITLFENEKQLERILKLILIEINKNSTRIISGFNKK